MVNRKNDEDIKKKAALIRKWCLIATTAAGSGHPTSCLSAADITAVLFDKYFKYDIQNPKNPSNDRFILSKGHAAPLLYALFAVAGGLALEELMTLRQFTSRLEGHPTPRFPYAEVTSGSLGQGLSIGAGIAYSYRAENGKWKMENGRLPKTYVLMGDGELAEGSVWEAANFASFYKLHNLIAIADINGLGQSQGTMFDHNIDEYINRFSAFGWEVIAIDGHNIEEIDKALSFAENNKSDKPFVIIARTEKGKGISFLEGKDGWHGKALKKDELEKALIELGDVDDSLRFKLKEPNVILNVVKDLDSSALPQNDIQYKKGEEIATREVYGKVLAELGEKNQLIYALDGDTKNSTYSQDFLKAHSERFIECFIAEQNMVGVAVGLSVLGKIPFVSTFAAFLTRAFDQIRMAAVSGINVKFVGSHAGISIGEDGPSQMGLEDMAMFGAFPNSVVLHPADAISASKLIARLVDHKGISYLRTLRPKTPVLYDNNEDFKIGGSKILRNASNDSMTIVAAGITVHEALKAYEILKKEGILVTVIDCYSVKPIDKDALIAAARGTKENIIVSVEDHFEHGGLGDFVMGAVSELGTVVKKMAVTHISRSGTKDEVMDDAGITAKHIVEQVKNLL